MAASFASGRPRCIDERFNGRPEALWEREEIGRAGIAAQAEAIRVDEAVSQLFQSAKAGMGGTVAAFDEQDGLIRGDGLHGSPKYGSLVALDIDLDEIDRSPLRTHIIDGYQRGVLPSGFHTPVLFLKRLLGNLERRGGAGEWVRAEAALAATVADSRRYDVNARQRGSPYRCPYQFQVRNERLEQYGFHIGCR